MEEQNKNEQKNNERSEMEGDKTSSTETPENVVGVKTDHDTLNTSVGTQSTTETISAGVTQPAKQKKKLSGAQRRKLLKAEKIAAGTWVKDNPYKKDHRKKEKNGPQKGVTEEPSGSNEGEQTAAGTWIKVHPQQKNLGEIEENGSPKVVTEKSSGSNGEQVRGGGKRPPEFSKTPPQASKKPRSSNGQTGSYSEVTAGLRMAVTDRRQPEVTLDQGQANLIENKLVDLLDTASSGSNSPIQFTRTTFSGGILWMTCANEFTKTWLREAVSNLGNLWEDADLIALESKDLLMRPKVLVFVPGNVEEEEAVRIRLGNQNPGLRVGGWRLLSRKVEQEGSLLAYSIDKASFDVLQQNQLRAYYRLGRIVFRVLKGIEGWNRGSSGDPPTQ